MQKVKNFPEFRPFWTTRSISDWLENAFVAIGDPGPCWMCDAPTWFIDLSFEARLCSEACSNEAWSMYIRDHYRSCKRSYKEHPESWYVDEFGNFQESFV